MPLFYPRQVRAMASKQSAGLNLHVLLRDSPIRKERTGTNPNLHQRLSPFPISIRGRLRPYG